MNPSGAQFNHGRPITSIGDDDLFKSHANSKDFASRRRSSSTPLPASPASTNKMSLDSDDNLSVASGYLGEALHTMDTSQPQPSVRSNQVFAELSQEALTQFKHDAMSDSESSQHGSPSACRIQKHSQRRLSSAGSRPRSTEHRAQSQDTPYRHVNPRRNLKLTPKSLSRVLNELDHESNPVSHELRHEKTTTSRFKEVDPVSNPIESTSKPTPGTPPRHAGMFNYQCSRLNPELEISDFQRNLMNSSRNAKRKAPDELDFELCPSGIFKRRAVSPSSSTVGSPKLSATLSQSFNGSVGGSGNAAERAQQSSLCRSPSTVYSLYEASSAITRMSLSE